MTRAWLIAVLIVGVVGACGKKDPSSAPAAASSAPAKPTVPPLAESCARVCKQNVGCSGATGADATAKQADCERVCDGQGSDALSSEVAGEVMARVAEKCAPVSCDKFGDCYMDTIAAMQQELTGAPPPPAKPLSPETRTKFVTLVCAAVVEAHGSIPDLNDPNPSPSLRELKQLAAQIMDDQQSATAIADLMKEAMATCTGAGPGSAKAAP